MGLDSYIFRTEKDCHFFEDGFNENDDFYENVNEIWYGRKANAIHGWFVDNVQGGEDDCRIALISEEKFKELGIILDKIADLWHSPNLKKSSEEDTMEKIKDKCAKILPTRSGFFFGDYGYDYYFYMYPILELRTEIKHLLANGDTKKYKYYYHASWQTLKLWIYLTKFGLLILQKKLILGKKRRLFSLSVRCREWLPAKWILISMKVFPFLRNNLIQSAPNSL